MSLLYFFTLSALFTIIYSEQLKKSPILQLTPHQWKVMEFNFPTEQARQQAQASGNLIPTNAMLIDVQPSYSS